MAISNFVPVSSTFKEEDSEVFTDWLKLYYELFTMFNGTLTSRFEKDKDHLKVLMRDFTYNFEKYFFKEDIANCFFNNVTIRGYRICPVDPKTYLYVQKWINSLCTEFPVSKVALFYEEYFLYSDLPQSQVEVLHKYLFLSNYTRREGYQVCFLS